MKATELGDWTKGMRWRESVRMAVADDIFFFGVRGDPSVAAKLGAKL